MLITYIYVCKCVYINSCVCCVQENECVYLFAVGYIHMCGKYLTPSHFSALRGSLWITVGERERTHALHDEMLYPTKPSAAPDASARAFVGAPQIGSRLVLYLFV